MCEQKLLDRTYESIFLGGVCQGDQLIDRDPPKQRPSVFQTESQFYKVLIIMIRHARQEVSS